MYLNRFKLRYYVDDMNEKEKEEKQKDNKEY